MLVNLSFVYGELLLVDVEVFVCVCVLGFFPLGMLDIPKIKDRDVFIVRTSVIRDVSYCY